MQNEINVSFTQPELATYTDLSLRNFSAVCSNKLKELKNRLVEKFTEEFADLEARLVNQAVDDAEALAALTVFPQLLLPTLAEEKVLSARAWSLHQQAIFLEPAFARAA